MYNEREFKSHLKSLKIRKILYMLIFSLLGSGLGVIISDYIVDVLLFNPILRVIIISVSTLFFFWVSTMITSTTEKDVQDGYWKLEVLNNLNTISKQIENIKIQSTLPENNPIQAEVISSEDNLLDVVILSDKNTTESEESTQITIEDPNLSLSDLEEKLEEIDNNLNSTETTKSQSKSE